MVHIALRGVHGFGIRKRMVGASQCIYVSFEGYTTYYYRFVDANEPCVGQNVLKQTFDYTECVINLSVIAI